jgi:hypothetical protein
MKKLLLYSDVVALNRRDHGDLSLKKQMTYEFARETNAVPLLASEFTSAGGEYAIVFTQSTDGVVPAVLLGARDSENIFIDAEGKWTARYVPAFVRRYPFVFASESKGETFTLMIDETYPGFNREGRGERLFDSDGEQTAFLKQTLNFLKEYQRHFVRTRDFGNRLNSLALLEPVEARLPLPQDPNRTLGGFQVVNRDRLKALSSDVLEGLMKSDELELIYIHLASLRNLNRLHEKMIEFMSAAEEPESMV